MANGWKQIIFFGTLPEITFNEEKKYNTTQKCSDQMLCSLNLEFNLTSVDYYSKSSILTDRPLRNRFFRNDEPHLVYQDGEVDVLFGSNISEFAGLTIFFGDGGFDKIGADDAISCVTDWWRRLGRWGAIDTEALGGDESSNEYRRNIIFLFKFSVADTFTHWM